ncbi:thermonuclease family protein [Bacillus thuringiensis]|nr:thermonuclease family protein [Bacillus thuringiensis]
MLCIDAPEVHHPRLGLQPFGIEGAALEMDVEERDKFKRLVI